MPNLIELYCAENELTGFGELNGLPQLKKLHLRKNQIVNITVVPSNKKCLTLRPPYALSFEYKRKSNSITR